MLNRTEMIEKNAVDFYQSTGLKSQLLEKNVKTRLLVWRISISSYALLKRGMDIVISLSLLLMLTPMLVLLALLIRIESPGSVLFSQTRIGLAGRPFKFWKFRSMRTDAEQVRQQLEQQGLSDGIRFKMKKDPRITRIGAVIRKFSIDELPQLWNVLNGDMSLVGPRPALPSEVADYTLADRQRLSVMPGITCIWQVSGRSDIPFKQQVQLDVKYKLSQSITQDIKLLFMTIPAVLMAKGAY